MRCPDASQLCSGDVFVHQNDLNGAGGHEGKRRIEAVKTVKIRKRGSITHPESLKMNLGPKTLKLLQVLSATLRNECECRRPGNSTASGGDTFGPVGSSLRFITN